MYTTSGFGRGCQETESVWKKVCVCKCHVYVRIHSLCNSTIHKYVDQDRQSAACRWVSCPVETDRGREGETLGKAPRLLGKSARVRYHFGGVSLHTPHLRKHLQPLQKASIIHSISVKWFADRGVCLLSFLPICARTLQLWQGQVRCMD